ncbi:hypothetical protein [Streptomyces sp. NPDC093261]|uniref:hypothetical protein n=1 Tax=Streptomyces sp. NPDC093261 TaxID=3366037 RepID=UPI00381A2FF6
MTGISTLKPRRPKRSPRNHTTASRLRRAIGFALVRGASQATGGGIVSLLFWWIAHR